MIEQFIKQYGKTAHHTDRSNSNSPCHRLPYHVGFEWMQEGRKEGTRTVGFSKEVQSLEERLDYTAIHTHYLPWNGCERCRLPWWLSYQVFYGKLRDLTILFELFSMTCSVTLLSWRLQTVPLPWLSNSPVSLMTLYYCLCGRKYCTGTQHLLVFRNDVLGSMSDENERVVFFWVLRTF